MQKESETILVVDDEQSVRRLIKRVLEQSGYTVLTASDGQEALDMLQKTDIGTMLVDMKMPGMNGKDVIKRALEVYPDMCILMVTAHNDLDLAVEVMKLGAYDYITKPFNVNELTKKVSEAIDTRNKEMQEKERLENLWPTGLKPDDWDVPEKG